MWFDRFNLFISDERVLCFGLLLRIRSLFIVFIGRLVKVWINSVMFFCVINWFVVMIVLV